MTKVQELFMANLKTARKQAGYSQEKMAELLDLSPNYISALEIGNRFPSPEVFQNIADVLHIQPYRLLLESVGKDRSSEVETIEGYNAFLEVNLKKCLRKITYDYIQRDAY